MEDRRFGREEPEKLRIRVIRHAFGVIRAIRDKRGLRLGKSSGFTLIEVLIAMAILGVGLVTLLTLFPVGLRSSRLAGDFTTASFIGQQALDNIRAGAQVYDPGDGYFDNTYDPRELRAHDYPSTNHNGLGYYELPVSAVKGYLSPLRFPVDPTRSQDWTIEFTGSTAYTVTGSASGPQGSGNLDAIFTANSSEISFILYDNKNGNELSPPYDSNYDVSFPLLGGPPNQDHYDKFDLGDRLVIHIEMRAGVPYYWYAMRAPVTEDQDLDGILDGPVPDTSASPTYVTIRPAPHNIVKEDTGLDLIPDYWDTNNDGVYQAGLDRRGEFNGSTVDYPGDPHGDNKYAYDTGTGGWVNPITANEINPSGTEGNGRIDAYPDEDIQKVTVIVGWREGSQDRTASFSASIANQFR